MGKFKQNNRSLDDIIDKNSKKALWWSEKIWCLHVWLCYADFVSKLKGTDVKTYCVVGFHLRLSLAV